MPAAGESCYYRPVASSKRDIYLIYIVVCICQPNEIDTIT